MGLGFGNVVVESISNAEMGMRESFWNRAVAGNSEEKGSGVKKVGGL